jgi:hypothetical protein
MKKILILLTLVSCEKESVVKCYTCSQNVMVNYHDTFRKFRECGTSASEIERFHDKPERNGSSVRTKCYLEK